MQSRRDSSRHWLRTGLNRGSWHGRSWKILGSTPTDTYSGTKPGRRAAEPSVRSTGNRPSLCEGWSGSFGSGWSPTSRVRRQRWLSNARKSSIARGLLSVSRPSFSVRHVLWACWTSEVFYLYHYDNASARWFADPSQPPPDNAHEIAVTIQAPRGCARR